jgi:hypothetical protein
MRENGDEWLTVSQAAARLGISERQARRYAAKLAPNDRRDGGQMRDGEHEPGAMSGPSRTFVRLMAMIEARERVAGTQSNSNSTDITPDIRPAQGGQDDGHKTGSESDRDTNRVTDSRLSRVEGYVARDLELLIGQAVDQAVSSAVAPLLERIESQAVAQALLMEELKELRKDRSALRAELVRIVEAQQASPDAIKAVIDNAVVPYMGQVETVWAEVDRVNEENARLKIELEHTRNPWWKFWRGLKIF